MTKDEAELSGLENTTKVDPHQLIGMTTLDWDALISEIYKLGGLEQPTKLIVREPTEDEIESMSITNEEA